MRFELSHPFDAEPDDVLAGLFHPDFQDKIRTIGNIHDRTVLSHDEGPAGEVVRRVRYVLALDVSGMARTILGDADPAWVQEERWDVTATTCEWSIHPEVAAELLTAAGTITIEGSNGKSTRHVRGEVRVRVPLYGGKVEGWIVDGVTRAYDEEAARLSDWLEREK